ncbi:maestro heat-like repeat-containing protein family member 1 isoform X2 [Tiliqua scincoides]|uniref:maestro heat-like repeat-containing protein family member 1 isoform X2 n=1 Tax=Tiliqua scincoides TaxID=71010 RepID=UPI0034627B11
MNESRVKRLATTLMDATTDKDPLVHEQIFSALCYLGGAEPEGVLNACEEYLRQHDKLAYPHRVIILRAMEAVVKSSLSRLDKSTAKIVILLASSEMTKSKDLVLEWQQAASSVLVAVGRRFINKVMEEVLTKFQPGVLPHYFVVQTFANLSVTNVFGMVPFLGSILGTMLPMLGMAKQDNMKSVFCYALQSFSESIQEYMANLDQAPDPTVRRDAFSSEIFSAYEVLFTSWLPSREAKLRLAVVEALGPMSHLLPSEKLEEQLPRLIPGLLALYRKPAEAYYVSKSLCQILEASVDTGSRTLDAQLDALLHALQLQICAPPLDAAMSIQLKNHNEVLRCFTVLASAFPDHVLGFLLPKLESGNERTRVGILTILRQIINSASSHMEMKKPFILAALKLPLQDNSNMVKRAMVQVISAMAHHGYLEQMGGEAMIDFLIRQCALPIDQSFQLPRRHSLVEGEDLTDSHIRDISVNTLLLLSTTVDRMHEVLWPRLLAFVVPVHLTNALTPLCRSLVSLATKRQEEGGHFQLHHETNGNLPSPYALVGRLLVVASQPYAGEGRGSAALRLLNVLHISIHKTLEQLWNERIPALVEYLEANTKASLSQEKWEEQLLQLLQQSLVTVSDATWTCQLTREMCRQLSSYNGSPSEKNFLYKCIGTTLATCTNKDLVRKQLQDLLETARYQEEAEREGLASCMGLCAVTYLDETLARLEEFVKSDVFRKSAGLFSIFKDRSDHEVEKVKSALILCYGHVAQCAPKELVLARIEADILRNIFLYFHTKDLTLKLCLIQSVCMICQAICTSAQSGDFSFSRKAELVLQMLDFIRAEPPDSLRTPIRQRAMTACAHLIALEPPLSDTGKAELIETCLNSVLCLPPPESPRERESSVLEAGQKERLWCDTLKALEDLLKSLLQRHMTPQSLQTLFEHLSPWTRSAKECEREAAMDISAAVLAFYREKLIVSAVVPFHNLGLLMALFSPRCTDSLASVRLRAVDCVYSLLYIQLSYEGFSRDHKDESVEKLKAMKLGLKDPDVSVLFQACCNIAKVIAKRLPPDQLLSLLLSMLEGLTDPDKNCSRAATVMINSLLKERGAILLEKVPEILSVVHTKLQEVEEEHIRKAAQQMVHTLASQHKAAVMSSLLNNPLPLDSATCTMWRALAPEPTLASQVLELLLEKVNRDVPYTENKAFLRGSSLERVATFLPLGATCALHEIMSVPESGPAVLGLYAQLFVTLLLRVSCSVGVQPPKNLQSRERKSVGRGQPSRTLDPCRSAVETLQAMLTQAGSEEVVRAVAEGGGWEWLRSVERHHEGVALLASAMAKHAGPRLSPIVKNLAPMLNSLYDSQRVTTTAFFAELLLSKVVSDLILVESIMDSMIARQRDSCTAVRMLALRGLGNMTSGSPEKVRQHGAQLLASMVNGMDDKDDPHSLVALEAMCSLSKVLGFTEETDVRSILLHIAIRIRPFFDSEKPELRTASITLFGNLTRCSDDGGCEESFFEQILNGLVTLLLHLQDPKPEVVKACKFALRMCGPSMGCALLCDMFQNHLHEDRSLHYGEFMNDVCKHLMQNYPDMLNRLVAANLFYFKSTWADIRAAAPMFVGFLILHVDRAHSQQLDLDELIAALAVLLKDPVTAVRAKVAETLGRLVRIA